MTWPMHDAGPTTPEPGPEDPQREDPGREQRRRMDPGRRDPGRADPRQPDLDETEELDGLDEANAARRGRHAAPDPLPPLEGPMLGGGPTPAETTLPLALSWP